jgi:hypothetical protein
MLRTYSSIEKIRTELAWVNEPVQRVRFAVMCGAVKK